MQCVDLQQRQMPSRIQWPNVPPNLAAYVKPHGENLPASSVSRDIKMRHAGRVLGKRVQRQASPPDPVVLDIEDSEAEQVIGDGGDDVAEDATAESAAAAEMAVEQEKRTEAAIVTAWVALTAERSATAATHEAADEDAEVAVVEIVSGDPSAALQVANDAEVANDKRTAGASAAKSSAAATSTLAVIVVMVAVEVVSEVV